MCFVRDSVIGICSCFRSLLGRVLLAFAVALCVCLGECMLVFAKCFSVGNGDVEDFSEENFLLNVLSVNYLER